MFRRRQSEPSTPPAPVDPVGALDRAAVPGRLLAIVDDAIASERRWRTVTANVQPGPLADRLAVLGAQVTSGTLELHAVAVRVGEVERILEALEPEEATRAYKTAKRRAADGEAPPELPALEARFGSVQRLLNVVADAEQQLRVLDARLVAAVATGAELAVTADLQGMASIGDDLDAVLVELGAMRGALASFGGAPT